MYNRTMNTQWNKYQKIRQWRLKNVAFSNTGNLIATLKYHATDECLFV